MAMVKSIRLSAILIFLGVVLLGIGVAYPLVTVVVDTSPPTIVSSVPAYAQTYANIDKVTIHVKDDVSGVSKVTFTCSDTSGNFIMQDVPLTLVDGTAMDGTWEINLVGTTWYSGVNQPGAHTAYFYIEDKAGNGRDRPVNYNIYIQLQGKWYVAGQEITSTSQVVYVKNATIDFRFVLTQGTASLVKCSVLEGTTTILTLTYSATNEWTGSYTFTPGTHTITLTAYDGTTTITFSVVDLNIPGAAIIVLTTQQILFLFGIISIIVGVVMRRKGS